MLKFVYEDRVTCRMSVRAILFDVQSVIYERPAVGVALQTLLDHYVLKPRHPRVVQNALRAAQFDANLGRISLDEFYNAELRIHGFADSTVLSAGREALRFDAGRLMMPSGTASALRHLHQTEIAVGALANSPYSSADEIAWLSRIGIPPEVWRVYLCSSEVSLTAPDPLMIDMAVRQFGVPHNTVALVSRDPSFLESAADLGLTPVAFRPAEPIGAARGTIDQIGQLLTMLAAQ